MFTPLFFRSERAAVAPTPDVIREALEQRTEDEVEAEIEMEAERKSDDFCAEPNCYAGRFIISRYCLPHYEMNLERLSPEEREAHETKLADVLKTLTYREREIMKLRWGFGDGYVTA